MYFIFLRENCGGVLHDTSKFYKKVRTVSTKSRNTYNGKKRKRGFGVLYRNYFKERKTKL